MKANTMGENCLSRASRSGMVNQWPTCHGWHATQYFEHTSDPNGIFDVKAAPLTGRHVVENVDKITETIELDRHVSSRSIAQEPKINHETILNHLRKVGFKKKLDVWVPHQLTPKNMMDRISICEALAKRSEIDG
ncbi:histone-lysine N-methyltransferase SETMAR [Trichonephila clavipes]|uniref:Histone-lysine N-methyltransferase SETMAR n=1 Tax=Trichonephila clavipes TaxID=2585209 RepID=A0A8X6RJP6_TRICX|nr:histone-lysine N-methyltransferase SETMAR [Trichonephila clavipes]